MITRRVLVNLVAFAVISAGLVAYGLFDLLGNPFAAITTVSTILPSASGLAPNFSVTYDGIQVGSVKSISLVRHGARVTLGIDPADHVPAAVAARVVIGNALGQQEVELVPRSAVGSPASDRALADDADPAAGSDRARSRTGADPARRGGHGKAAGSGPVLASQHGRLVAVRVASDQPPPLRSGAVLPVAPDSTPASVGELVTEATTLLHAIPAGDLNNLLHQAAIAVSGQADNLKTIDEAGTLFAEEFLSYQKQFQALLANAPPVLNTVTANAGALQQGLQETAAVVAVLANHRGNLVDLLKQGSAASTDLNTVFTTDRANLGCLTHDLAGTVANLARPSNYANLETFLETNGTFFDIVGQVAPPGPAKALTTDEQGDADQVQLRVRLLLPPRSPAAITYSTPRGLTTIRPGPGCDTEFGAGVGPAIQTGFTAADGGTVDPPTAAEAQVHGGGPIDPIDGSAAMSDDRVPASAGDSWLLVLVAVAGSWSAVAASRRRTRRGARSRRAVSSTSPRAGGTER